jgi:AcrR family transcriptional regulator
MCGEHASEQAAKGKADDDCLSRIGDIHDGERVRQVVIQRVGRHIRWPVGLAVAAAVERDAAEALAEIRQLRLSAKKVEQKVETSTTLLEAAKKVLHRNGYAALSTRDVAAAAGVPLSQIHYHFGSKQGMVLALFEYLNAQLLDRQNAMFGDASLKLSEQWDRACDYLDDDIDSGYVRVLQELIAASWADAAVGQVVRAAIMGWVDLIVDVARKAERELGGIGPLTPEEVGAFAANAFIGAESLYLLGLEKKGSPVRQGLRRIGDLVRSAEGGPSKR